MGDVNTHCRIGKVRPKLNVIHTTWEPNYELIEHLESALKLAKSGQAVGGGYALKCRDGSVDYAADFKNGGKHEIAGAFFCLLTNLYND